MAYTIKIEGMMKPAGRVEMRVTNFNEGDERNVGEALMKEILRLTDGSDFCVSVDVFRKVLIGKGES